MSINIGIPGPRVRSRCQDPVLLEDVLIDFPDLVVIGAHMGHPYEELLIEYMLKWPNLYLSNSAYLAKYMHPALVDLHGVTPWSGPGPVRLGPPVPAHGRALAAARALPLTDEAMERLPRRGRRTALRRRSPVVDRLTDQLRLMAAAYPDQVAYRNLGDGSPSPSHRWERESNRLARGLRDRGCGQGRPGRHLPRDRPDPRLDRGLQRRAQAGCVGGADEQPAVGRPRYGPSSSTPR